MRIDPQIHALRSAPAGQRAMQFALETVRDAWLAGPAQLLAGEFAAYGQGLPLAECRELCALFESPGTALRIVEALIAPMLAELAEHPLGHVPLRHQYSDNLSVVELMKAGRATLTLIAYDEFELEPVSASFSDAESHEIVLAGAADLSLVEFLGEEGGHAALGATLRRFVAGEALHCADCRTTRHVIRVYGRLVVLRLARSAEYPRDTRQYALADGRLLHQASGSREESRREIAMALLGRMGRKEVAPLLAELSREGSEHIRWQSLRECLALDSGTGFAALSSIAVDPSDPLARPAGALRAQLLEAHPQLLDRDPATCRA